MALKELSNALQSFAEVVLDKEIALPWMPIIVDLERMKQSDLDAVMLDICGIKHNLLRILSLLIFGEAENHRPSFYHSELAVMADCRISRLDDLESVVLQLQLEQKLAKYWLDTLQPWTASRAAETHSDSMMHTVDADTTAGLDDYTRHFMSVLLDDHNQTMLWTRATDSQALLELTTAANVLVAAAIRVQVIAASMHGRLIRIVVPGWLPSWCQLGSQEQHMLPATSSDAQVPDNFLGIVPLSKDLMQPGAKLLAAQTSERFPTNCPDVAAVFCQEPAVVQVAERVGDFSEFVGARQQHRTSESPYKVLIRARMAIATR